ncbi:hypothetical protein K2173_025608 [Erythroxylum novogranatense]|uniref:Uncharacterized protein n=1 Tax=Erythroxylum novogranatense TaxID=1862640 RepID=A0AAV8TAN1_9ROSI|nr:hypothetical protein K2173_025608 [Erythroxylum novogranatense]
MQLSHDMEKDDKDQRACKTLEPEFFLQWGNKKRLRCVRVRDPRIVSQRSDGMFRRKSTSGIDRCVVSSGTEKEASHRLQSNRLTRNSEAATLRSSLTENRKSTASPEKEDRYYTTRGSVVLEENGKVGMEGNNGEEKGHVWPKLYITLSSKEKEEDFMAMKGCKLPHRPKKRAKIIQRTLLVSFFFFMWGEKSSFDSYLFLVFYLLVVGGQLVSPGAWLTDMCQERYEVKEKKSAKKVCASLKKKKRRLIIILFAPLSLIV